MNLLVLSALWAAAALAPEPIVAPPAATGSTSAEPAARAAESPQSAPEWNERCARHLLNRAGFGARPEEVRRAVERGRAATVASLLAGSAPEYEPFFADVRKPSRRALRAGDRRQLLDEFKRDDRRQLAAFGAWWVDQMISGGHPLREKMTLFWHGYFTSSYRTVKRSDAMIAQNELFRTKGLGSFRELLTSVLRDPAMLIYLDGVQNTRESPNENLARELMELFTLGEGHYSEQDVKEAARALTGWGTHKGRISWSRRRHDDGQKTILGRTGPWDQDDLVGILLERPECPRFLAGRLLEWFEGVQPDEARREEYAGVLARSDYDVSTFLETLFNDPRFYRDEIVGQRVASPIEYLAGTVRRLRVRVPPVLVVASAGVLGQRLFQPPNVKGWEGGMSWITTSTYQARGNFAGMLLGVVDLQDVLSVADLEESGLSPTGGPEAGAMTDSPPAEARRDPRRDAERDARARLGPALKSIERLDALGGRPHVNLTSRMRRAGVSKDGEIVRELLDQLLAVQVSKPSRKAVTAFLRAGREELGCRNGRLLRRGYEAEMLLRRTAHLILSLPEAYLN